MERRKFLLTTCSVSMCIGAGLAINLLESCTSLAVYKTTKTDNKITAPLILFEKNPLLIIRVEGLEYDIAVRKSKTDNTYLALLLRCTHAANELNSTGNGFVCSLHGSKFDLNGNVLKGPAERKLRNLDTLISGDNIIVLLK